MKALGRADWWGRMCGETGLCKVWVRLSRIGTGWALDWLSMGLKCADQVLGEDEVYLVASNIGFLQKQTRPSLFAVCFSSCDLLWLHMTSSWLLAGIPAPWLSNSKGIEYVHNSVAYAMCLTLYGPFKVMRSNWYRCRMERYTRHLPPLTHSQALTQTHSHAKISCSSNNREHSHSGPF